MKHERSGDADRLDQIFARIVECDHFPMIEFAELFEVSAEQSRTGHALEHRFA